MSASADGPAYRAVVFQDLHVGLGIAARLMLGQPAFAGLPFGPWMGTMLAQAERGHVRFFLDADETVRGFFGYGLCSRTDAEAWAFRDARLDGARCREGPCMIVNAWIGLEPAVRPAMVAEARHLTADKEAFYFKRFYPDGRVRPVRLPRTRFHGALALAGMP